MIAIFGKLPQNDKHLNNFLIKLVKDENLFLVLFLR